MARVLLALLGVVFLGAAVVAVWVGPWGAGLAAFALACSFVFAAAAVAPSTPRAAANEPDAEARRYTRECRLAAASCAGFAVACAVVGMADPGAQAVGILGAVAFGIGAVALLVIARTPERVQPPAEAPG